MKKSKSLLFVTCIVYLFLIGPLLIIAAASFSDTTYLTFPGKGFTLRWYGQIFQIHSFIAAARMSAELEEKGIQLIAAKYKIEQYARELCNVHEGMYSVYNRMNKLIDGLLNLAKADYRPEEIKMHEIRLDETLLDAFVVGDDHHEATLRHQVDQIEHREQRFCDLRLRHHEHRCVAGDVCHVSEDGVHALAVEAGLAADVIVQLLFIAVRALGAEHQPVHIVAVADVCRNASR